MWNRRSAGQLALGAALLLFSWTGRAWGDESMLPAAMQAGRLDALLERSGAGALGITERRAIAQIYASYVERYATLRDARVERWASELDELLSLRSPPGERAIRELLAEHRALCERAAELDRGLFEDIAAIAGSTGDFDRLRALRDVDRWTQTMPLHIAVGVRGDIWSICRHLDLSAEQSGLIDEALRERDLALPGLIQRVWLSWRDLLLAAARSFDLETGGVLPVIGATLSEEEAKRLRERITSGCLKEAEECRAARQRVRELDRRTIERVLAAVPPMEGQEFAIRVMLGRGVTMTSLVINVESCFRCALARLGASHAARGDLESAYRRWSESIARLAAQDLKARDGAQDDAILKPSQLGDLALDGSEEIFRISTELVKTTEATLEEIARLLEPYESELVHSGIQLYRVERSGPDGSKRSVALVASAGWQRQSASSFKRTPAEVIAAERSASLLLARRAGIAPAMSDDWIRSRLPEMPDAACRERWESAIKAYVDDVARDVETPLRDAVERALAMRKSAVTGLSEDDVAQFRRVIAARDDLFFVNERLDEKLFTALAESMPRGADRRVMDDIRFERTLDRELHCVGLMMIATANPWTALRDAAVDAQTNDEIARSLRDAMRWFLPDLRRARAAEFASASATDIGILRSGIGIFDKESRSLAHVAYEADRQLEQSFESLLERALEAAGDGRERFATTYARATMLPEPPWSVSTQAIIDGLGPVGLQGDRLDECRGRIRALGSERERFALDRAMVRSGVRTVRNRGDEARRLAERMSAIDDQLRAELLGLLTQDERRALTASDGLDRLLECEAVGEATEE